MAESAEDGSLPPGRHGETAVPGDEAAGKTRGEVSVLNGDCGMVAPGGQAGADGVHTHGRPESKSEIPRRSSIIKVKTAFYNY